MAKITFNESTLVVEREPGDPKFYGKANAAGESKFLYWLKTELNKNHGYDLIKKRMWKDGHLMDDMQQYLRTRSPKSKGPHVQLWNDHWAICGLDEDWNAGHVAIRIDRDIWVEPKKPAAKLTVIFSGAAVCPPGSV
jgi:hypothetical protein